jgi:prepilin-type N-terminal cleavage/methylation domain-containing protein
LRGDQHSADGFTLVELVCVLVLIGVLAGLTSSYMFEDTVFDQRITTDSLLGLLRVGHQKSMTSSGVNFQFIDGANDVTITRRSGTLTIETRSFSKDKGIVTVDIVSNDGTVACSALSATVQLDLAIGGEISGAFSSNNYAEGFLICIDNTAAICISPAGFAYKGSCV